MAKAKSRRRNDAPSRTPVKWTIEEAAALLAYAKQCPTLQHFEDTVVEIMKQKWPCKVYDYYVIKNKTYRLWQKGGRVGTKWQDIITEGPEICLSIDQFEEEEKSEFKAVGLFEETTAQSKQASPPRNKTATNASRSISRRIRSPVQSAGVIASPSQEHTSHGNHLVRVEIGFSSNSPSSRRKKRSAARREPIGHQPAKAPRRNMKQSSPFRSEVPDSDNDGPGATDSSIVNISEERDIRLSVGHITNPSEDSEFEGFVNVLDERDLRISEAEARISLLENQILERDNKITALNTANEELRRSNIQLSNQVLQRSRALVDCQRNMSDQKACWNNANKNTEKSMIARIKDHALSITRLDRRLVNCKLVARFQSTPRITSEMIAKEMSYIQTRIKDLLYKDNMDLPHIPRDGDLGPTTEILFQQATGIVSEAVSVQEQLKQLARDVGIRNVLRAVTAAALCKWVFESDFYNFDEQESQLLAMYRRLLISQHDGPSLLHNLDFAAHYSLFKEEYFNQVITDKAQDMAVRFSKLLAPFFPHGSNDTLADGFQTWGQNEDEAEVSQALAQHVFEYSLRLKVNILLTEQRYEVKTFAPGTTFSSATMAAETRNGAPINAANKKNPGLVRLCLFPVIYEYPADDLPSADEVESDNLSRVVLQSCNFYQPGDNLVPEKGMNLGTAVVVLENSE